MFCTVLLGWSCVGLFYVRQMSVPSVFNPKTSRMFVLSMCCPDQCLLKIIIVRQKNRKKIWWFYFFKNIYIFVFHVLNVQCCMSMHLFVCTVHECLIKMFVLNVCLSVVPVRWLFYLSVLPSSHLENIYIFLPPIFCMLFLLFAWCICILFCMKSFGETANFFYTFLNFVLHAETVLEGFDKTTPGKDYKKIFKQQQDQHDTPHN